MCVRRYRPNGVRRRSTTLLLSAVVFIAWSPATIGAQARAVIQKSRLPVAVQKKLEQGQMKVTMPSGAVQEVSSPVGANTVHVPLSARRGAAFGVWVDGKQSGVGANPPAPSGEPAG